jgi:hypothetical protein
MLASDFSGLPQFLILGPAVLLLIAVIGLFLAVDGNRWSLLLVVLPVLGGCFFGSLVLFYPEQTADLGLFYCFWLPAPLIVSIVSIVTLIVRRRALSKKYERQVA